MSVVLRTASTRDLPGIAAIERASFDDAWTELMFVAHLRQRTDTFVVAALDGRVVGYCIARCVADTGEVLNIAVDPTCRRSGLGAMLLDFALSHLAACAAREVWLEVRESNIAARALYASRGFAAAGRRKKYYQSPREDALVLRAIIGRPRGAVGRSNRLTQADTGLSDDASDPVLSPASIHTR